MENTDLKCSICGKDITSQTNAETLKFLKELELHELGDWTVSDLIKEWEKEEKEK